MMGCIVIDLSMGLSPFDLEGDLGAGERVIRQKASVHQLLTALADG